MDMPRSFRGIKKPHHVSAWQGFLKSMVVRCPSASNYCSSNSLGKEDLMLALIGFAITSNLQTALVFTHSLFS